MLMGNFITEERLFMEIRQGYSYHIKDEFFDLVQDKYLMSNKQEEKIIVLIALMIQEIQNKDLRKAAIEQMKILVGLNDTKI